MIDKIKAFNRWANHPKRVYKIGAAIFLLMFLCGAAMVIMQTAAGQTV